MPPPPPKDVPGDTVWYAKLEWLGYVAVKKVKKSLKICLFVLTECTNVTDGRTDGQTHRMTA